MTAEIPQIPLDLDGLESVLNELDSVVATDLCTDEACENVQWLEVLIKGMSAPPEVCKELGRGSFGIAKVERQGYGYRQVEIVEETRR